jgi:lysophospholipase L1-like esterase
MNDRPDRWRRRLVDASLVAGTLVVLVPVAEIVVRVADPRTLPSQEFLRGFVLKDMYTADEAAGYRLSPAFAGTIRRGDVVTTFSTNSLGLRAPEVGPKDRPRILAFGDSFTWGWGVGQGEEWISVAGRELGCEAINCGVNGYGTENELALLSRVGPELSPDLVLVGFFANDYTDNLLGATGIYTVRDGYLFDRFSHEWFQESFLARESHLYRLVTQAWETARVRWLGGIPSARPVRQFTQAEFRRGMELSAQHLVAMRDRAAALGAAFGVVWLPADVYALSRKRPRDIPLQEELKARIESRGIPSIDLLPLVTREPDPPALYIAGDGHFTALGHAVAGRAVARWITERSLLP